MTGGGSEQSAAGRGRAHLARVRADRPTADGVERRSRRYSGAGT